MCNILEFWSDQFLKRQLCIFFQVSTRGLQTSAVNQNAVSFMELTWMATSNFYRRLSLL